MGSQLFRSQATAEERRREGDESTGEVVELVECTAGEVFCKFDVGARGEDAYH